MNYFLRPRIACAIPIRHGDPRKYRHVRRNNQKDIWGSRMPFNLLRAALLALEWTAIRYALIGSGFLCLVLAGWLAVLLIRLAQRLVGRIAES
jgi:hypothetical protein